MAGLHLDEMPQYAFISEEEYFALEERAVVRHEYFDGEIFAMAGASNRHVRINTNVIVGVGKRLFEGACYTTTPDHRVKVQATGLIVYPDMAIACPPERFDTKSPSTLLNPKVIVEILSPSTRQYDRTVKLEHYKQIEELMHCILIEQDHVEVEHYYRDEAGNWQNRIYESLEDVVRLPDMDLELPVVEIYLGINLQPEIL